MTHDSQAAHTPCQHTLTHEGQFAEEERRRKGAKAVTEVDGDARARRRRRCLDVVVGMVWEEVHDVMDTLC
jgi:hypothetical protein